jgi:serine/threonine-protein kinase HipA
MILRKGIVYYHGLPETEKRAAGCIEEHEDYYLFYYLPDYLKDSLARPVSLTLPLQAEPYKAERLFSFFDGLIPEGWLLGVAERNWKLDSRDRMGLLPQKVQDEYCRLMEKRAGRLGLLSAEPPAANR